MFAPVFQQVSERHPDAVFGKVDTEAQPELAAAFGISSIPTLMIIRDKVVLYAQPGALPEQALEQLIAQARAIDMDELRASIAKSAEPAGARRPADGRCRYWAVTRSYRPGPGFQTVRFSRAQSMRAATSLPRRRA